MIFKVLLPAVCLLAISCFCQTRDGDYYWKDYHRDTIPTDAFVAGEDLMGNVYIGQGYVSGGYYSGTIRKGANQNLYVIANASVTRVPPPLKILCAPVKTELKWITYPVSAQNSSFNYDRKIIGGHVYSNKGQDLPIIKTERNGEIIIGHYLPDNGWGLFALHWEVIVEKETLQGLFIKSIPFYK